MTHRQRRERHEVLLVDPREVILARELEVRLVHQVCRGERATRTDRELTPRGVTQLVVENRNEAVECRARVRRGFAIVGHGPGRATYREGTSMPRQCGENMAFNGVGRNLWAFFGNRSPE